MADKTVVITTDPTLTVKLIDAGTTFPAVLLAATLYEPSQGDVVTALLLDDGRALVLGVFS
jgi:hypothetical protein